jgi:hypothetical protein
MLSQRMWRALIVMSGDAVDPQRPHSDRKPRRVSRFRCGTLVLILLRPPKRAWRFWGAGALGVVAGGVAGRYEVCRSRAVAQGAVEQGGRIDGSAENRMVLLEAQMRMAAGYPHGAGHRGTAALSPQYLDREWLTFGTDDSEEEAARSSHNTFMTVLVEQGIPGS